MVFLGFVSDICTVALLVGGWRIFGSCLVADVSSASVPEVSGREALCLVVVAVSLPAQFSVSELCPVFGE